MTLERRTILALCMVLLIPTAGSLMAAKTNYVSVAGTNFTPPYTAWELATTNIQDAVNDTDAGDTVLVSNGVYYITNQISLTNTITLKSLMGASSTIVARAASGTNDPKHRIFLIVTNALLDGFTAQNGIVTSSYTTVGYGAGILMCAGTAQYCVVRNNIITGLGGQGAGVYIAGGTMRFSSILSNSGARAVFQTRTNTVPSMMVSNTIAYNSSGLEIYGGAGAKGGPAVAQYCIIERNAGNGVYIASYYSALVTNCIIRFNTASQGGGVYFSNGPNTLEDCMIVSNTATSLGGAAYGSSHYGAFIFRRCVISGNTNDLYPGIYIPAGGDYAGGGSVSFDNCLITDNTGLRSVYLAGPNYPVRFLNCTIAADQSIGVDIPYVGSNRVVISQTNIAYPLFQNTIIYKYATNIFSTNAMVLSAVLTNSFTNSCSPQLVEPGSGNITNNPLFIDGGWRLSAGSPCINTGTNQAWMTNQYDLGGNPRIRYGFVDIGAYEVTYDSTLYYFR